MSKRIAFPGRPLAWAALLLAAGCCAWSLFQLRALPTQAMQGELTAVVAAAEDDGALLLEDVWLRTGAQEARIPGRVRFVPEAAYSYSLTEGAQVRAAARLAPLEPPDNPHGWDERSRLFTDGVVYNARGEVLAHRGAPRVSLRVRARAAFRARLEALWPDDAGVMTALLLGAKDALSDETYEAFRRSGAAHLLAVSGLHVGFVLTLVSLALRGLRRSSWVRIALTLAGLAGYGLLAESAFSVFRAMVMAATALLARRLGRRADGLSALSLAVILALALRPFEVMRIGFLMSVGAVLCLLLLGERMHALLRRAIPPDGLRAAVVMTLCAQAGALPVEVFAFHTVPVLALLTNLAAIPLAAGAVMLGLPAVLLEMLAPGLGAAPAWAAGVLARGLTLICEAVSALPGALQSLPSPPILVLLCFFGLLYLCSAYLKEWPRRVRRALNAGILTLTALALGLWMPGALRPAPPQAVFLSVGTADSALLRSPGGNALIDTGWSGGPAVRALLGEGESLNAVILTHRDADHTGGLPHVLRSVEVGAVYLPLGAPRDGELSEALRLAQRLGVPVRTLRRGDALSVGDFSVEALWPDYVRPGEDNADSLVLRVTAGGGSALFLSDVTAETEDALGLPRSDVVKLAHHGSGSSTTARTLRMTAPQAAVLSVGSPNRYGFPHPQVLARLADCGAAVYRTDQQGAILMDFLPDEARVRPYAPPTLAEQWLGISPG